MSEYLIQCSAEIAIFEVWQFTIGPSVYKGPSSSHREKLWWVALFVYCRNRDPRLLRARSGSGEMELLPPFLYIPLTMRIRVEADNPRSSTLQLEQIASGNVG